MQDGDATRLAAELDRLVQSHDLDPLDHDFIDDTDEYREFRNRRLLDQLLSGALRKGNRLELWDRMVTEDEFLDAVPCYREAPIDLAVCHSAMLGRRLQFERRCPVLMNRRPTGIVFRLTLPALTVDHLLQSANYVEPNLRLRQEFAKDRETTNYRDRGTFA